MTCIVAYKENDTVWMAAESLLTDNSGSSKHEMAQCKIVQKGDMLIGLSGYPRVLQLLEHSVTIPDHDPRKTDMEYLCGPFAEIVMQTCYDMKLVQVEKEYGTIPANFLVAYRGNVYEIFDDMYVCIPKDGYAACGSGRQLAMGVLYALSGRKMKGEDRVRTAVEAACKYDPSCGGNISIFKIEQKG